MILVDSSVWIDWSNDKSAASAIELDRLLGADEVAITDVVVAEVLQGARSQSLYEDWLRTLDALHYLPVSRATWLGAARLSFQLRRRGHATALSDLLVAQVALDNQLPVLATDTDFERIPGLLLHRF